MSNLNLTVSISQTVFTL